ncbi:MAG TPA: hypothetical protein VKK79_06205 [Candidatus Lokiarchaeia archaeon]|nr:hypothetical protein [Candidatus Lokiarchaeia archaeon]
MPEQRFQVPGGRFSIEVRQDSRTHKTTLHIFDGDGEILNIPCVHVVITVPATLIGDAESVDDLINVPIEARLGGEPGLSDTSLSDTDVFWAHCSNVAYWLEAGLPPEGLASNLSVPILQAIANREPEFARELIFTVTDLVDQVTPDRTVVVAERYGALLPGAWWADHLELIGEVSPDVLLPAAQDPHSPPELLAKLASSSDSLIRSAVASNSNISPEVAYALMQDPFMDVRYALASNARTPPEILLQFASYRHILMRTRIAQNPSSPLDALRNLFQLSGLPIKQLVIENPAATRDFLEELLVLESSEMVKSWIKHQLLERLESPGPV